MLIVSVGIHEIYLISLKGNFISW